MYIMQPAHTLVLRNSFIVFPKYDQILNCQNLTISNSRVHLGPHNHQLFINVVKARLAQCQLKHNVFNNFKKLERLYIKGTVVQDQHQTTDILAKLIVAADHLPLRHISLQAAVEERSLFHVLQGKTFPLLEVLSIRHQYLTTNTTRLVANMKTGCLKKLNLKGCPIATRKEFAEDLRATTTMDQLTAGYVKYAQKRDNFGMKRDGIIRRDQD